MQSVREEPELFSGALYTRDKKGEIGIFGRTNNEESRTDYYAFQLAAV